MLESAVTLAFNDPEAIRLSAAELRRLKDTYKLNDRLAYTAYACSDECIRTSLRGGAVARQQYPLFFDRAATYETRLREVEGLFDD